MRDQAGLGGAMISAAATVLGTVTAYSSSAVKMTSVSRVVLGRIRWVIRRRSVLQIWAGVRSVAAEPGWPGAACAG